MRLFLYASTAVVLCLLVSIPVTGTAGEVGIFLSSLPTCEIRSAGISRPCRKDAVISSGDVITTNQDPSSLPIQWIASRLVRLEPLANRQYRVVFTPPLETRGVLSMLADLMGFARRAGRVTNVAVTRSSSESQLMLPGDGATLLPGQPVTFSWCAIGVKKILITTEAGVKHKELAVPEGQRSLTLLPEELGLAPKVTYRWKPLGASSDESGRIRLLDSETAKGITEALRLIDKDLGTQADNILKKAAFLQFVSENYSNEYSLGWLQYSLVSKLPSQIADGDRGAVKYLKNESGVSYCW